MKNMRIFALVLALFSSSNLLAVVFPSYVSKPLTDLKLSKAEVHDGITIAAKYLDKSDLTKLFGSHADNLEKKFRVIQCTVENETNNDLRLMGNGISGLELVKAADVASVLNPMTWTRLAATIGLPLIGSFLSDDLYAQYVWGYTPIPLPPLSLEQLYEPTLRAFSYYPREIWTHHGAWSRGSRGESITSFGLPVFMWTTAAVSLYKTYRTSQLIKKDLANKMLSPDGSIVVAPNTTKNFLLITPKDESTINRFTIAGIIVPVD